MPAPSSKTDYGALLWDADDVKEWIEARSTPARKGAVPKSVLQQAIFHLEHGRRDAAIEVMKEAL